jgi:VWFA-related protein
MKKALLVLAILVVSAAVPDWPRVIGAQSAPAQTPVFKSKVEVVQLDVSVLDKHRQPVRGLTQKDFTIFEDGKPQPIVGFSTFDLDNASAPVTGWMRDVAPDVATNLHTATRLFVIVMDDALIPQDPFAIQSAKTIAASIIDKLGPDDLTAIVFTGDNRKTQDFTSDKAKMRAALDRFNPGLAGYMFGKTTEHDPPGMDTDLWFYQSSVRTLSSLADYLIAVPGKRKSIFFVSPGAPLDLDPLVPRIASDIDPLDLSEARRADPWALKRRGSLPPETMVDLARRMEEMFRRAQRANVTIYPIDPTGLGGMDAYLRARLGQWNTGFSAHKATAQQDYLAAAAANTGGRTVMNTNDFDPGIAAIFEENASYYQIGFEATAADGKLRQLDVKVNRPGVEVHARSSYYAPEAPSAGKKPDKNPISAETVALQKAMGGILPMTGMPMRASIASFAVPGQRLPTVAIVLGITQPVPASAANGRVTETTELLTSAFTPEGDAKGAQTHKASVVLRAGSNGDASYEVLARIDLPPGRYQLRLAAHNSTSGRDGSVYADVTVPDYSNTPFSASPILLGATPGRVSAPKGLFTPLLPFVPTAEREFARTDKLLSFLRLYQSGQKPIEAVTLTIRIRDGSNQLKVDQTQLVGIDRFPAVGQQIAPLVSSTPTPSRTVLGPTLSPQPNATGDQFANYALRMADISFPIPIDSLTAGDYLLTFEATLGATTLRRDVRLKLR